MPTLQYFVGRPKLIFNEMTTRISACSMKRTVRTHYPDFEPTNLCLLFLINAACLAERRQIPNLPSGLS